MTLNEYRLKKNLTYRALANQFGTIVNNTFRWCNDDVDARVKMVDGIRSIVINKVVAQEVKKGK